MVHTGHSSTGVTILPAIENSHVLLLLQDFAPPKPLVDLLIEQSPKLAVKLWAKVSVKLWAKLLPFKWRGFWCVFIRMGLHPSFSDRFLKHHPLDALLWIGGSHWNYLQVDLWFKAVKAGKGSPMYDARIYNVMHALEAMPRPCVDDSLYESLGTTVHYTVA